MTGTVVAPALDRTINLVRLLQHVEQRIVEGIPPTHSSPYRREEIAVSAPPTIPEPSSAYVKEFE